MDHLAILSKEKNLLGMIMSGKKTIESRWYTNRKPPFRTISPGDTVYFKESGKPVTCKATVDRALFFDNLDAQKIGKIISEYGKDIGIDESYIDKVKNKRLCTLVFLRDVKQIEPFAIDKKGYGTMSAWLTVDNVRELKR